MRSRRRIALVLVAALVAAAAVVLVVRACSSDDPRAVLGRLKPASSGEVRFEVEVRLAGLAALAGPFRLTLEGPFVDHGPGAVPEIDWDVTAVGAGERIDGGLVVTRERSFVRYEGRAYAVPPEADRELRASLPRTSAALPPFLRRTHPGPFDPGPRARIAGTEEVAGEELTRIEGPVDEAAALAVIERLWSAERRADASIPEVTPDLRRRIRDAVREPRFTASVAEDDTLRRGEVTAMVVLPPELSEQLGGVGGGTVTLTTTYSELGRPQRIEPPPDPLPFSRLERRIQALVDDLAGGARR